MARKDLADLAIVQDQLAQDIAAVEADLANHRRRWKWVLVGAAVFSAGIAVEHFGILARLLHLASVS